MKYVGSPPVNIGSQSSRTISGLPVFDRTASQKEQQAVASSVLTTTFRRFAYPVEHSGPQTLYPDTQLQNLNPDFRGMA